MGNGFAKLTPCFAGDGTALRGRRHVSAAATLEAPGDESVGHSFCYVRPDLPLARSGSSKVHHSEETTTFRSISGAAVSANPATPLSTALLLLPSELTCSSAASFESSTSFSSVPLQPVPRFSGSLSGPLAADHGFMSGPLASDRGFMSGPLAADRGFMSGPLADRAAGGIFSGPLDRPPSLSASSSSHLHRSLSQTLALHRRRRLRPRRTASSLLRGAAKAIARTISAASKFRAMSSPIKKSRESDDSKAAETTNPSSGGSTTNLNSGIGNLTTHPSSDNDQMSMEGSENHDSSEAPTSDL